MPVLEDGHRLGRYQMLRYLGRGISGESYEAEDLVLRRTVTVKIIHPWTALPEAARRQFFREMQNSSLLNHPYLAALLDYGEIDNKLYVVRRFTRNGSLLSEQGRIQFQPPLNVSAAFQYTYLLAQALYFIHSRGCMHGSLTLANILVTQSFDLAQAQETTPFIIADAGLAHFVRQYGQLQSQFLPITAAPEQFDKQDGPASDQYALAVLLYFWLAGCPPFLGSPAEIERFKRFESFISLASLNSHVTLEQDTLIRRALSVNPADRFPSIVTFADALLATLTSSALYSTPHVEVSSPFGPIPDTDPLLKPEANLFLQSKPAQDVALELAWINAPSPTQVETRLPFEVTTMDITTSPDIPTTDPSLTVNPQPQPNPLPQPAPEPLPQPAPEPLPVPAPEPLPQPAPEPSPQPAPEPLPGPAPEPLPQPAPDIFQPLPQPDPEPLPLPQTDVPEQEESNGSPVVLEQQAAPVVSPPRLMITFADAEQTDEFLLEYDEILLGRAGSDDILLNQDTSTSRHHALLRHETERYVIYDQRSTNGVFVNGQKLNDERGCPLTDGDAITIGNYKLIFQGGISPTFPPPEGTSAGVQTLSMALNAVPNGVIASESSQSPILSV